jgi:hypothetical protein
MCELVWILGSFDEFEQKRVTVPDIISLRQIEAKHGRIIGIWGRDHILTNAEFGNTGCDCTFVVNHCQVFPEALVHVNRVVIAKKKNEMEASQVNKAQKVKLTW